MYFQRVAALALVEKLQPGVGSQGLSQYPACSRISHARECTSTHMFVRARRVAQTRRSLRNVANALRYEQISGTGIAPLTRNR